MSNAVMPGQFTVFGGAEHSPADVLPIATVEKTRSIKGIYFSYGRDHIPLETVSRFYVDLNIHVKTVGYAVGDVVNIYFGGSLGRSLSAVVGVHGIATVSDVLMDERIEMMGEM